MAKTKEKVICIIGRIITIGFLLWAYTKNPIGYYTLLRFVVFGTCIYCVYTSMKYEKTIWIWIMAFIAILFNPIIPIYLKREHWEIIDAIVILIFLLSIPLIKQPKNINKETDSSLSFLKYFNNGCFFVLLGMIAGFVIGLLTNSIWLAIIIATAIPAIYAKVEDM